MTCAGTYVAHAQPMRCVQAMRPGQRPQHLAAIRVVCSLVVEAVSSADADLDDPLALTSHQNPRRPRPWQRARGRPLQRRGGRRTRTARCHRAEAEALARRRPRAPPRAPTGTPSRRHPVAPRPSWPCAFSERPHVRLVRAHRPVSATPRPPQTAPRMSPSPGPLSRFIGFVCDHPIIPPGKKAKKKRKKKKENFFEFRRFFFR